MNGQTQRIAEFLKQNPNREIPAVLLHKVGSTKLNGWCSSFTRRISDCRKLGMDVKVTRDVTVEGQRFTYYTYTPPQEGATQ